MSRRGRTWVLSVGIVAFGCCLAIALLGLPHFGTAVHAYRDLAIAATVQHSTPNAISSVNFDQRPLDTFGEETILLASVIGVAALLRPSQEERNYRPSLTGRVLEPTRILGYVGLPATLIIGINLVTHGHLTPGGGFQGGVVIATGIHLLYVAGSYPTLDRLRPVELFEQGEAIGAGAFACLGLAGVVTSGGFLTNLLGFGTFGRFFASGTVPLLNGAVGLEVASGVIVLLAKFLEQAILLGPRGSRR
ncbi:MAG TPA: MnhB domain-containing protein [Mycobacteriales bacterium]|jgi:multicomponent Na+:H+ antiporter subunit B|nr:MnhB domain-containing protein [Mycobacteriales bacterium]